MNRNPNRTRSAVPSRNPIPNRTRSAAPSRNPIPNPNRSAAPIPGGDPNADLDPSRDARYRHLHTTARRTLPGGRRLAWAAVTTAAVLLAAGCGADDGKTLVQSAAGSAPAGSGAGYGSDGGYGDAADSGGSGGSQAKREPARQLAVRDIADVGPTVTDSRGFTLYRFDKDTANPPASDCEGSCATTWPPVPADDATAGSVIDPGLLGEVVRGDGTRQLTLAGWPVYRYAPDTKPGEAKGEGVGGTWHALGADGKPAAGAAARRAADPAPAAEPSADPAPGLAARQNSALGTILVDGKGRTLYRFDKDSAWPMKTRCTGPCLDVWKPAPPVDRDRVVGVDPALVNSFTRPDGSKQLAVDCWLLYTYTGDTRPGDVNGQGKDGVWWAVKENGKKAGK
ncbi:SCO0930 family lipoprotein [Streptomyces bambusae]|uniref:SCO0930 family lipoprotein n=1 Tax=Streptomyces bambusae TaxID=1550616 RepID=UPI001CFD7DB1|nr:SCO0930 family lipoprotein [Streptomyces bambusae]MCB5166751.1 SCO0930 family lipoprotein [Streptomyces bambusae]